MLFLETSKVKKGVESNKLVLCEIWIDYCFYFFLYVDPKDFTLSRDLKELSQEVYTYNFPCILEKNKENISKFYSLDEENLDSFISSIEKNVNDVNDKSNNNNNNNYSTEKTES